MPTCHTSRLRAADDNCPSFPGNEVVHFGFEDTPKLT